MTTPTLEEMKNQYNEMWNRGEFEWNHHDGETAGTKPFSLERIWNVFIEPQLIEAITTAKREALREVAKQGKNCHYGHEFDPQCERCIARAEMANDIITHLESELK